MRNSKPSFGGLVRPNAHELQIAAVLNNRRIHIQGDLVAESRGLEPLLARVSELGQVVGNFQSVLPRVNLSDGPAMITLNALVDRGRTTCLGARFS